MMLCRQIVTFRCYFFDLWPIWSHPEAAFRMHGLPFIYQKLKAELNNL